MRLVPLRTLAAVRRDAPLLRQVRCARDRTLEEYTEKASGHQGLWGDEELSSGPPPTAHAEKTLTGEFRVPPFDYTPHKYPKSTFVGIDLGTTNSCVSAIDEESGVPYVIPNDQGKKTTPTLVVLEGNRTRYFGEEGKHAIATGSGYTMCSGKRLLGKMLHDRRVPLQRYRNIMELEMTPAGIGLVVARQDAKGKMVRTTYPVVHIMAMFLRHLKITCSAQIEQGVDQCVVAVPAHFNAAQRKATEDAAIIAGMDVLEIIDEPTAAALAYSVVLKNSRFAQKDRAKVLVFDLGGGTFDVAILQLDFAKRQSDVLAQGGDDVLGGDDFDVAIQEVWSRHLEEQGADPGLDTFIAGQLQKLCEQGKIALDTSEEFQASVVAIKDGWIKKFPLSLTRFEYEEIAEPLLHRIEICLTETLAKARLAPEDIDDILLVGEMTRTPMILNMLERIFKRKPLFSDVATPGTVVAMGAAIRAQMMQALISGKELNDPNLPKFTFDKFSPQYEKHLPYHRFLLHRLTNVVQKVVEWYHSKREHFRTREERRLLEKGLSDEQIAEMSKEVVGMEMRMAKQAMLQRLAQECRDLLKDISLWKDPRQGFKDPQIDELIEVAKFWLNVVDNSGAGEEHLAQAIWELRYYFSELSGQDGPSEEKYSDSDLDSHDASTTTGGPIRVTMPITASSS